MVWGSQGGRFRWSLLAASMAIMLTLAACGDDDQEPTPTPSPADAVALAPTPTPEPEPTSTSAPEPTATPTMYVPAPTVAAPLYEPPAPPVAPPREDDPEATPVGQEPEPIPPEQEPEPEPTPAEPAPDPTPVPDVADEPDEVSGLLLSSDLRDMFAWENETSIGVSTEEGFRITNTNSEGIETWERTFALHEFANIVASIDVRNVGAGQASIACLGVRTGDDGWDLSYSLCLSGYGESFAEFRYIDVDGVYRYEELVELAVREGTFPTNEWNRLIIVANGQDLGFLVNDELIGVAIHPTIESGGISFAVGNYEETPAAWVFTNLEVWDAQ